MKKRFEVIKYDIERGTKTTFIMKAWNKSDARYLCRKAGQPDVIIREITHWEWIKRNSLSITGCVCLAVYIILSAFSLLGYL